MKGLPTTKADPCIRVDPTKVELEDAIRDGFCWWCGATHGTAGKQIIAWAHHWALAHGIPVARVRELLEVGKRRSFVTEALRRQMSERATKQLAENPEHREKLMTAAKPGSPTPSPEWARRAAGQRLKIYTESLSPEEARAIRKRAADTNRCDPVPCAVCRRLFQPRGGPSRRKTCSAECNKRLCRKLSLKDVRWIRKARESGLSERKIADRFNVCRATIRNHAGAVCREGSTRRKRPTKEE